MDNSGGLAGAMDWLIEMGVGADPLTAQIQASRSNENPSSAARLRARRRALLGRRPDQLRGRGSFDPELIASTDLASSGEIQVETDLLVHRATAADGSAGLLRTAARRRRECPAPVPMG